MLSGTTVTSVETHIFLPNTKPIVDLHVHLLNSFFCLSRSSKRLKIILPILLQMVKVFIKGNCFQNDIHVTITVPIIHKFLEKGVCEFAGRAYAASTFFHGRAWLAE